MSAFQNYFHVNYPPLIDPVLNVPGLNYMDYTRALHLADIEVLLISTIAVYNAEKLWSVIPS